MKMNSINTITMSMHMIMNSILTNTNRYFMILEGTNGQKDIGR
jgi:hypothetical protein